MPAADLSCTARARPLQPTEILEVGKCGKNNSSQVLALVILTRVLLHMTIKSSQLICRAFFNPCLLVSWCREVNFRISCPSADGCH